MKIEVINIIEDGGAFAIYNSLLELKHTFNSINVFHFLIKG